MKALVGAFNQEEALVGALSVIMKSSRTFVWSSTLHPCQVAVVWWRGRYLSVATSHNQTRT